MEHPLVRLIDDVDLLGTYWNKKFGLFPKAAPPDGLIDEHAIQAQLDAGLLRWPYFTLMREGNQPAIGDFTRSRNVLGQRVGSFADPERVRSHLAAGATMKFSQLEDWHLPIRTLMRALETRIAAELKAYVFYTPCDNTGMLPHRDGSHVLALQLAGAKEWTIYDAPDQIDARPGLNVDADSRSHTFVMEPGDILYLPHGFPHVATARGGTSLHLTFTITEPTPRDLAGALMATFEQPKVDPALPLEDRAAAVAKALLNHLDSADADALVGTAVERMRDRTVR
ncbi:JmjC domain-containing protein [Streptomyces sp. Wb2n-11]|uniref:JmjC domain-containing protein n=1 Tax=Streptomyces sp. Wb2n-11 TaxID=1030533 RepID=UPI000A83BDFE|nr:cupin domain-containing protein [Streptomyces sp. Wb2n-11]